MIDDDSDLADAIVFLESSKNIVIDFVGDAIDLDGDGQCWPDVKHLAHRRSARADKSQIQMTWCRKNDGSPSPAHVNQSLPFVVVFNAAHVEGKYIKEDLFGKHLDCKLAYVEMMSGPYEAMQTI